VKMAADTGQYKLLLWFRYGDKFVAWPPWSRYVRSVFNNSAVYDLHLMFYGTRARQYNPFLEVVIILKGQRWPQEFIENQPTIVSTSDLNLIVFSLN
jgi:hypothetical protein